MTNTVSRPVTRKLAVIVGGSLETLVAVEPVLEGRAYDIEFVAVNDEPYGTVLAMKPDLVVVNLGLSEPAGFHLLSMLQLDPATRNIPVLSYVRDDVPAPPSDLEFEQAGDDERFDFRRAHPPYRH